MKGAVSFGAWAETFTGRKAKFWSFLRASVTKKKRFSEDGFFIHSINQHYLLCCRFVVWLCFISTFSCSFISFPFVFFPHSMSTRSNIRIYNYKHYGQSLFLLLFGTSSTIVRWSPPICSLIRCVRNTESTITVSKRVSERESEREKDEPTTSSFTNATNKRRRSEFNE